MKSIDGALDLWEQQNGKPNLSIDLAVHFQTEIIISNTIQVYKGLNVVTNKVTELERQSSDKECHTTS